MTPDARNAMKRRTFLIGVTGLSTLVLTACVSPAPRPSASATATSTPAPTPTVSPVPKPAQMRRTSWSADPFARGSYSFAAVDSTPEQRTALAQPVLDRVFFAGEATSTGAPGTVQGGRDSGLRAAREIIAAAAPGERIAVIGAGIAGLSAARILKDAGFDVVLVEARDRIGGRIDTVSDKKWPFPVELGPSFVSHSDTTSLDEEFTRLGIATTPFPSASETRTNAGIVVAVPDTGEKAVATALAWATKQASDMSVQGALDGSGASTLSTADAGDGVSAADWLEFRVATVLDIDAGASVDQQSGWYTSADAGANEDRIVLGGYAHLLTKAAEGIDLLDSSVVTKLAYTDTGVSLRLGTGESLSADRVLVTVPLGVLKSGVLEFDPALPFAHRGAIADLGMGTLDKVWLQFDEPFWSTTAPLWTTVGGDEDFRVWINMMPLTGEPVLVGLVAGDTALRLAGTDDATVLAAALRGLTPFYVPPTPSPTPTPAP
ncbi:MULTISPECIES: flavin monoamine oxidase family protein [unclassified Cryobacterium]|uniref:flavin monoamine oxidase family protein n=2 Tax=Cryobacterium TaxID=69578 RepID=UPI0010744D9C|nr:MULTISPECIES: FAD-dependent oxidoreductase [unclassified Cryobacterium]